jgi:vacuolar-type H+-ATPase subunit D/Vma8
MSAHREKVPKTIKALLCQKRDALPLSFRALLHEGDSN